MAEQRVSMLAVLQDRLTGPLNSLAQRSRALLQGIQTQSAKLAQNNGLRTFFAAAAGAASGSKAIALAKEQLQSETRLRAALQGRAEAYDKIKAAIDRLAGDTGQSGEDLAEVAATLRNLRVEAEKIPRALQTTVDLAAALGIPLAAAGKQIALLLSSGQSGALAARFPVLKQLEQQGTLARDGLDALGKELAGIGRASIAPELREQAKAANDFEQALGGIGKVLINVQKGALRGLTPAVAALQSLFKNPAVGSFVKALEPVLPVLSKILLGLAGLRAAQVVFANLLGPPAQLVVLLAKVAEWLLNIKVTGPAAFTKLKGALALLFGPLIAFGKLFTTLNGGFIAILIVIGGLLAKLAFDASGIGSALGSAFGPLARFFGEVVAGRAKVGDLFDAIGAYFRGFGRLILAFLWAPIVGFVRDVYNLGRGLIGSAKDGLDFIVLQVKLAIARLFNEIELFGFNLGEAIGLDVSAVEDEIAANATDLKESVGLLTQAFTSDGNLVRAINGFSAAIDEFKSIVEEVDDILANSRRAVAREARQALVDGLKQKVGETLGALRALSAQVAAARSEVDRVAAIKFEDLVDIDGAGAVALVAKVEDELRQPLSDLISNIFQDQFRRGQIGAEELAQRLKALREDSLRGELQGIADARKAQLAAFAELERKRQALQERAGSAFQFLGFDRVGDFQEPARDSLAIAQDLSGAAAETNAILGDQARILGDIAAGEKRRAEIATKLVEAGRADLETRRQLARETRDLLDEERERFEESLATARDLASTRQITGQEAFQRISAAASDLAKVAAKAKQEVQDLLRSGGTDTARDVETLSRESDKLLAKANEAARKQAIDLSRQLAAETTELASRSAEEFERAATRTQRLFSAGRITGTTALADLEAAAASLTAEAERARVEVQALLADGGAETAKDIEALNKQLDGLNARASEARLALAETITSSVDAASSNARQLRDEARQLADEGRISRAELVAREANALASLDVAAQGALDTLSRIRATNPELAEQIDVLEERVLGLGDSIRTALPDGNFFTGFAAGIRQALAPLDEARELGLSLGSTFVDSFASLSDVIVGTGRSIQEWVSDFLRGLAQIILRFAILKALGAAFGFLGFSEGGAVPVLSRAGGGPVPGVDTGRDTVPAMLRPKEWVIRPEAVHKYGSWFFDLLNRMAIPTDALMGLRRGFALPAPVMSGRFATGGEVGSRGLDSGGGSTIVVDEVFAARLAKGGRNALRQFMRENADAIPARRGG